MIQSQQLLFTRIQQQPQPIQQPYVKRTKFKELPQLPQKPGTLCTCSRRKNEARSPISIQQRPSRPRATNGGQFYQFLLGAKHEENIEKISWKQLTSDETSWNQVKPVETRWNQLNPHEISSNDVSLWTMKYGFVGDIKNISRGRINTGYWMILTYLKYGIRCGCTMGYWIYWDNKSTCFVKIHG